MSKAPDDTLTSRLQGLCRYSRVHMLVILVSSDMVIPLPAFSSLEERLQIMTCIYKNRITTM
jgi:hypothetical protein